MNLPGRLNKYSDDINKKMSALRGALLNYEDVVRWICQFNTNDQEIAVKIFLAINYFDITNVYERCRNIVRQATLSADPTKIRYCQLGMAGESGGRLLADMRVGANIPQEYCIDRNDLARIDDSTVEAIVFVDDFLGSGNQAINEWEEKIEPQLQHFCGKIYYAPIVHFSPAIDAVRKKTNFEIIESYSIDNADRMFHEECDLLGLVANEKLAAKARFKKLGEPLFKDHPLGWRDGQFALVFYYGPPNNSLPILWSSENGWSPLFPRRGAVRYPPIKAVDDTIDDSNVPVNDSYGIVKDDNIQSERGHDTTHPTTGASLSNTNAIGDLADEHKELLYLLACADAKIDEHILAEITQSPIAEFQHRLAELAAAGLVEITKWDHMGFVSLRKLPSEVASTFGSAVPKAFVANIDRKLTRYFLPRLEEWRDDQLSKSEFILSYENLISKCAEWALIHSEEEFLALRKHLSPSYLKRAEKIAKRLTLGENALRIAGRLRKIEDQVWILIDDIGWSYAVEGKYDLAASKIREGMAKYEPQFGSRVYAKAWRHLAGIDIHQGNFGRAFIILILCYSLARHSTNHRESASAMAEIDRGLGILAEKAGNRPRALAFLRHAEARYDSLDDKYGLKNIRRFIRGVASGGEITPRESRGRLQLLLVRHPETEKNRNRLFGQAAGGKLTSVGERAVDRFVAKFSEIFGTIQENTVVLSSPANSCEALRVRFEKELSCRTEVIHDLRSIDTGMFDGRDEDSVARPFKDAYDGLDEFRRGLRDGADVHFPEGEEVLKFERRVTGAVLNGLYNNWPIKRMIVLGHRSTITALLNACKAKTRSARGHLYQYEEIDLAGVYECRLDLEDWALDFREWVLFDPDH